MYIEGNPFVIISSRLRSRLFSFGRREGPTSSKRNQKQQTTTANNYYCYYYYYYFVHIHTENQNEQSMSRSREGGGDGDAAIIERCASHSFRDPHGPGRRVTALVGLKDGSLVSCSQDKRAMHWSIDENDRIRCVGFYLHRDTVIGVLETTTTEPTTLITVSKDCILRMWNIETGRCTQTRPTAAGIRFIVKVKPEESSRFVCVFKNGSVEMRHTKDLSAVSYFKIHSRGGKVRAVCALDDGSFVSVVDDNTLKRWRCEKAGSVLQSFVLTTASGEVKRVASVMELKRDVVVTASEDGALNTWRLSTGSHLRTLSNGGGDLHRSSFGMVELKDEVGKLATIAAKVLRVWDDNGDCIQTITTETEMTAIARLVDGSIATCGWNKLEVRKW